MRTLSPKPSSSVAAPVPNTVPDSQLVLNSLSPSSGVLAHAFLVVQRQMNILVGYEQVRAPADPASSPRMPRPSLSLFLYSLPFCTFSCDVSCGTDKSLHCSLAVWLSRYNNNNNRRTGSPTQQQPSNRTTSTTANRQHQHQRQATTRTNRHHHHRQQPDQREFGISYHRKTSRMVRSSCGWWPRRGSTPQAKPQAASKAKNEEAREPRKWKGMWVRVGVGAKK